MPFFTEIIDKNKENVFSIGTNLQKQIDFWALHRWPLLLLITLKSDKIFYF